MRAGFARWWMGGCLAALLVTQPAAAQRSPSVKLELSVAREQFLLGESIGIEMRLHNTGDQAVEVPKLKSPQNTQPVYQLEGPEFAGGKSFSLRDLDLTTEPVALRTPAVPDTVRLAAGASLQTGFKLDQLQAIAAAGDYVLSAGIVWAGWSAASAPLRFTVAKAHYLEASLGVDTASPSTRQLRAVWLADTASGRVLGETFHYEQRPDLSEFKTTGSRIITPVGRQASAPFCPWTNFDRGDAANAWHGWREGRRLLAIAMGEERSQGFELDGEQASIVRPALLGRDGHMDVLTLGAARRKLQLVRFFAPREGQPVHEPAALWSVDLAEPAQAARVAIGPASEGGSRLATLVSRSGANITLSFLRMTDKAALPLGGAATLEKAFLLPASEPGLTVAADGSARAALVFARDASLRSLAVADIGISRSGETSVVVTELGRLASTPVLAAAAFRSTSNGADVRTWFAAMADGSVLAGGNTPRAVENDAKLRAFDFLRMSAGGYVLTLDPNRGTALQPADF